MSSNQYTQKSMEAIQNAQALAGEYGNQELSQLHLLAALTESADGLIPQLLTQMNVNASSLRAAVLSEIEKLPRVTGSAREAGKVYVTADMDKALREAAQEAARMKDEYISVEHLMLGILNGPERAVKEIFRTFNISKDAFLKALSAVRGAARVTSDSPEDTYDALKKYGSDLTELARNHKLDPVIGRDREIRDVIRILSRKSKNNPVLIGEPGVGKTAIAEGLAQRIAVGQVPYKLQDKQVFLLDLTALVAGTQFRGQFESRMKGLIEEVRRQGNIILVIDEVHSIVGAGDAEGSMNAANILKPALSRGEIQVIGATTFAEYRKHIEKDSALERRFQPVTVGEPSIEDSARILRGIAHYYEDYHGVTISDEMCRKAVVMSERYITDRFLPDKAIDLIDEACSDVNLKDAGIRQRMLDEKELADIRYEREVMGLFKYNRNPKNRQTVITVATSGGLYHASNDGFCIPVGAIKQPSSGDNPGNYDYWGAAHELGHVNQTKGFRWIGLTEVTNNLKSALVQHVQQSGAKGFHRLEDEASRFRYYRYLDKGVCQGKTWLPSVEGDVFATLVPFWQLLLYTRMTEFQPDAYPDLYEKVRSQKSEIDANSHGWQQVNFMRQWCHITKTNYLDFFAKVGMFKTIDQDIGDYSTARLTITQSMLNSLTKEIEKAGYEKAPEGLIFIDVYNYPIFRDKLPLEGNTIGKGCSKSGSNVRIQHAQWKNVVGFETYTADGQLLHITNFGRGEGATNGSYFPNYTNCEWNTAEKPAYIMAVGYDGTRIKCYEPK